MRDKIKPESDRTIVWITANTFIRLPLDPVLTFPPAGTKLFPDGKITLRPPETADPNVLTVEVRLDL